MQASEVDPYTADQNGDIICVRIAPGNSRQTVVIAHVNPYRSPGQSRTHVIDESRQGQEFDAANQACLLEEMRQRPNECRDLRIKLGRLGRRVGK